MCTVGDIAKCRDLPVTLFFLPGLTEVPVREGVREISPARCTAANPRRIGEACTSADESDWDADPPIEIYQVCIELDYIIWKEHKEEF